MAEELPDTDLVDLEVVACDCGCSCWHVVNARNEIVCATFAKTMARKIVISLRLAYGETETAH